MKEENGSVQTTAADIGEIIGLTLLALLLLPCAVVGVYVWVKVCIWMLHGMPPL